MCEAIRQANSARENGDYAIGAVIANASGIISSRSNRVKRDENPNAHAEILAVVSASKILQTRHLMDCVLYTTHEPCPMCAALCVFARLKGIVFGARIEDMKNHAKRHANQHYLWRTIDISTTDIVGGSSEQTEIVGDFMRKDCVKLFHD